MQNTPWSARWGILWLCCRSSRWARSSTAPACSRSRSRRCPLPTCSPRCWRRWWKSSGGCTHLEGSGLTREGRTGKFHLNERIADQSEQTTMTKWDFRAGSDQIRKKDTCFNETWWLCTSAEEKESLFPVQLSWRAHMRLCNFHFCDVNWPSTALSQSQKNILYNIKFFFVLADLKEMLWTVTSEFTESLKIFPHFICTLSWVKPHN